MSGFLKAATLVSITTAMMTLFVAIPMFIVMWIFWNWDIAQRYALSTSIGLGLLYNFFVPVEPNETPNETFGRNAFIAIGLIATVVYTVFFYGRLHDTPKPTANKSSQVTNREPSCYDIGLKYGAIAYGSMQGKTYSTDIIIPERCKGDSMTNLGIKNAIKYSQ